MTRIPKLTFFKEVQEMGDRWLKGDKAVRAKLADDLVALRRPKGCLYPAAIHRYIVKEYGFPAGSEFVIAIMERTCE